MASSQNGGDGHQDAGPCVLCGRRGSAAAPFPTASLAANARGNPELAAQAAGESPQEELAAVGTLALDVSAAAVQTHKSPRDAAQETNTVGMGRSSPKGTGERAVVLELPGLRVALLTNACDSLRDAAMSASTAVALLVAGFVVYPLVGQLLWAWLRLLLHVAVSLLLSVSTFFTCSMLAMEATPVSTSAFRFKPKRLSHEQDALATDKPTLPLLAPERLVAAKGPRATKSKQAKRVSALPAIRRRVLAQLKQSRPVVNFVAGETRRRADMALQSARIRVGKAHLQAVAGARKPQDMYVVRVDCSATSGASEKHMNPVVMWDLTATFAEFQKLERELKHEMKTERKAKQLRRSDVRVPHLSSGAVLFVQRELTDDVLAARRLRLQAFVDAVLTNELLAGTLAMRKFCQAY